MIRTDDGRKAAAYQRITHREDVLISSRGSAVIPSAEAVDIDDDGHRCVSCGYEQHDQPIDRCPECGLGFASLLRDQTPWSLSGGTFGGFLSTAGRVLSWNRRLRIQTAYVPCTPLSNRFALLCIALAVLPLALATPVALGLSTLSSAGLVSILLGAVAFACLASGTVQVLHVVVRGTWRRRLPFVPASVDYACAWWPPIACVSFLIGTGGALSGAGSALWFATVTLATTIWMTWLWGSASESGHVRYPFGRILVVTLASCALAAQALLLIWRYSPAIVAVRAIAAPPRAPTAGPSGIAALPRTYALAISPRGDIAAPVMEALAALGAADQDLFRLEKNDASLVGVSNAVAKVDNLVQYQDTLIVYLNTTPGSNPGTLATADSEITPEKLCSLLKFRARDVLLILDGFPPPAVTNALSTAKDLNVLVLANQVGDTPSETTSLTRFWEALSAPEADLDNDGDVTVREAYWRAYPDVAPEGNMLTAARLDPSLLSAPRDRSLSLEDLPRPPGFFRVGNPNPEAFAVGGGQALASLVDPATVQPPPWPDAGQTSAPSRQPATVQAPLGRPPAAWTFTPPASQAPVPSRKPGALRSPAGQAAPWRLTAPTGIKTPSNVWLPNPRQEAPSWSSGPMRTPQWPVAPLPPDMQPAPIPLPGQRPRQPG